MADGVHFLAGLREGDRVVHLALQADVRQIRLRVDLDAQCHALVFAIRLGSFLKASLRLFVQEERRLLRVGEDFLSDSHAEEFFALVVFLRILFDEHLVAHEIEDPRIVRLERLRTFDLGEFCELLLRRLVRGSRHLAAHEFGFEFHLLLEERIVRRDRLEVGEGQRDLVHVDDGAARRLARHHLRDELLLVFERLPHEGVERAFCNVAVDFDALVLIARTYGAPHALLQVRRPPRDREVMRGAETVLHVRADAEFVGRAEQNAHLAFADFLEKLRNRVLLVFLHDGDLFFRDASGFELLPQIVVDVEGAACFGDARTRRVVAEDDLRALEGRRLPVLREDVPRAAVDLARWQVLGRRVDDARI